MSRHGWLRAPFFFLRHFFFTCLSRLVPHYKQCQEAQAYRRKVSHIPIYIDVFDLQCVTRQATKPRLLSCYPSVYIFLQSSVSFVSSASLSLFFCSWPLGKKNMDEANGKMRSKHEDVDTASLSADILNPFVHRLELDTTYDKLKVSSSSNLPARENAPWNRCSRVGPECFRGLSRAGRGILRSFQQRLRPSLFGYHSILSMLHMPVCV